MSKKFFKKIEGQIISGTNPDLLGTRLDLEALKKLKQNLKDNPYMSIEHRDHAPEGAKITRMWIEKNGNYHFLKADIEVFNEEIYSQMKMGKLGGFSISGHMPPRKAFNIALDDINFTESERGKLEKEIKKTYGEISVIRGVHRAFDMEPIIDIIIPLAYFGLELFVLKFSTKMGENIADLISSKIEPALKIIIKKVEEMIKEPKHLSIIFNVGKSKIIIAYTGKDALDIDKLFSNIFPIIIDSMSSFPNKDEKIHQFHIKYDGNNINISIVTNKGLYKKNDIWEVMDHI